jgi:hypothetical protein
MAMNETREKRDDVGCWYLVVLVMKANHAGNATTKNNNGNLETSNCLSPALSRDIVKHKIDRWTRVLFWGSGLETSGRCLQGSTLDSGVFWLT